MREKVSWKERSASSWEGSRKVEMLRRGPGRTCRTKTGTPKAKRTKAWEDVQEEDRKAEGIPKGRRTPVWIQGTVFDEQQEDRPISSPVAESIKTVRDLLRGARQGTAGGSCPAGNGQPPTASHAVQNVCVPSSFEKLEGASNYLDWKFAMESHLFNCELWDFVDGTRSDERLEKRAKGSILSGVQSK